MGSGADPPTLLTERVSQIVGVTRLSHAAGYPRAGPYLVPVVAWLIGGIGLSSISYVLVRREQFQTPFALIIPVGSVIALALAYWLRSYYVAAATNIPGDELGADELLPLPVPRLPDALVVIFYLGYLVTLSRSPAEVSAFVAAHGPLVAYTKYIVVTPFYLIVIADLGALLLASMIILPWKIYRVDVDLDFSDITGFAGLYEVGRLLQVGTICYFLGLSIWTALLVTPSIVGGITAVSATDELIFAGLWSGGVLLYLFPFVLLHRHMAHEKERHIDRIGSDVRLFHPPADEQATRRTDPTPEEVLHRQQMYIELQQVRESREYPINTTMFEDLILGALIPIAFEWTLSRLLPLV